MALVTRVAATSLLFAGLSVEAAVLTSHATNVAPKSLEFLSKVAVRNTTKLQKDSEESAVEKKSDPIMCKASDFDSFDLNKNGKLAKSELDDAFVTWFKSRDPEMSPEMAELAAKMFADKLAPRLKSVDKDHDGSLSRDEFVALREARKEAAAAGNSTSGANSTGANSTNADGDKTCKGLCQEYSVDETFQRECITECRVEADMAQKKDSSIRNFAKDHSPAAREAYEEAFDEPVRKCVPKYGADHLEELPKSFKQVDHNDDGSISEMEALTFGRTLCVPWKKMVAIIKLGDQNKDEKLCEAEWSDVSDRLVVEFAMKRFYEMCLDGDNIPAYGHEEVVNGTNGTNATAVPASVPVGLAPVQ